MVDCKCQTRPSTSPRKRNDSASELLGLPGGDVVSLTFLVAGKSASSERIPTESEPTDDLLRIRRVARFLLSRLVNGPRL